MEDIKIVPPKGYEIDRKNSTLDCIKFRPIQSNLPKTWEEFCENYPIQKGEAWMDVAGNINKYEKSCNTRNHTGDKTVLPSKEIASAMVALCQLIQLRDYYNDGWEPDWSDTTCNKWCIEPFNTRIDKTVHYSGARVLAFKSDVLRDKFLENFKDLLEIAKPLI